MNDLYERVAVHSGQALSRIARRSLILLALAIVSALPAAAQVVFDAASNATPATVSTANPVTVNWNHTVGLAKKPYLVVSVTMDLQGGAATVGSVTWGSEAGGPTQAMTFLGAATNGTIERAELWGLPNPTAGTHQITVSVTNGGGQQLVVTAGAKSFTNVLQTAAASGVFAATGTSTTPAVAVTNSAMAYVADAVAINANTTLTPGASQTNSYSLANAAPAASGGGSIKTGVANTTMSWTAGASQAWAIVAAALQPATPQILFDTDSSTTFTSAATTFTGSWNHTTTSAANRYLVVTVDIDLSTRAGNSTGVVYGTEAGGPNSAMTLLGAISNGTNVRSELWGLVAPASGTHQITVTVSNPSARNYTVVAGAQSFSGVEQTAPTGTVVTGSNNTATPSVTPTNTAYDYVVDTIAWNTNTALTEGARQDKRYGIVTTNLTNFSGASSGSHGYANSAMSWTPANGTAQNWAMAAVPLKPVSVALTKTASADVIKLGDTVTYTIRATNYGSAAATTVTITDAIPAGANFVSQTGCAGTGPVSCNIGTLAAGATSAPITITVLPTVAGTISNVATVAFNGSATTNSSETVRTLAEARVCATPGKDGAGGTLAGIKNDYWPGSASVAAGAATMTIGARTAGGAGNTIASGDLLIVMQMQDAAFDTTNDETYGEGTGSTKATGTGSGAATSLNNAGRWEYVVATNAVGAGGGTLTFNGGGTNGGLLYSYTSQTFATTTTEGQRTFQVIRVPQYTTATLGSTLTALPWNGATGGVLAIDVSGTMTLAGATVSVNGLGFRGGAGRTLGGDATAGLASTDFRTLATMTTNGSKAEGIAGTPRYVYQHGATIGAPNSGNAPLDTGVEGYVDGSYGRGAPGNAGGGSTDGDPPGNDDNSGGGGGGNGGNGGAGGNGWNCNCPSGGQGGGSVTPSLTRISLGGGGGAGTTNNASAETCVNPPTCRVNVAGDWVDTEAGTNGYYSSGANGGGIIIMRAMQATGTATLTANGFTAYNTGRDGAGGGGAGGSVLFTTQIGDLSGLTVQAKGGNGGNAWLTTAPGGSPGQRHGPGGGGGGGYILLSSAAASTDVSPGQNGVTTTANDDYGAQPGTTGVVQLITGNNVLPGGDGASCVITDLAVTNTAPATVQAGNNYTYTQSVQNLGAFTADGVVYMAPIPASTTFQSISVPPGWTCITPAVGGTGVVTCTTPTLAAGATANFSLTVNSFQGTVAGYVLSETNSVSSNTPDSNPSNNQATALTIVEAASNAAPACDMAVTISESPSLVLANNNIAYTQTVSNLGTSTAQAPVYTINTPPNTTFVSLTPPAGWTCITPAVGGTGTITCSAASLAAGASVSIPLTVKVNAGTAVGTVITASPSVASSTQDLYTPNNSASINATVVASGSGDVGVTISSNPNPLYPNALYSYTVGAVNNGPNAAANVSVAIPLPAGTNFRSITPPAGWSCTTPAVGAGGTITCTIASLASGASATFTPQVQVNSTTAAGTTLNITTTITTTSTDNISSNNSASTSNLVTARTNADVAIVKTDSPDPVGVGQLVTYRLAVTNNGPAVATNVTVSDPLPASVTLISTSPSIGSCSGTTTINCALGSLPVGNTQYVNVIVQTNSTGTITNTATASRTETDPVPGNDSSTANTTVLAVTLVRLRDFTVTQDKDKTLIAWETSFESDNLGFNIWRESGGQRVKVNKQLIAGSALISKKHDSRSGRVYRFRDKLDNQSGFVQYWLEDVDIAGRHTMHGPVTPYAGTVTQPSNTTPLPGLGANGTVFDSPAGTGVVRTLPTDAPSKKQLDQQSDLAGSAGLKIYVAREGWYRVTRAAMAAAGYDPGTNGRSLSLYMNGVEQPIVLNDGGDNRFDPNDSIEFYGLPIDTVSTGARTYWLRADKGNGSRVDVSKTRGGDPVTGGISFTYDRKERSIFFAALTSNGDADNFFGPLISSEPVTQTLNVGNLDTSYGGNATLAVDVQGGTDMGHPISVSFNGHDLGSVAINRQDRKTFTFAIPQSWLVAGANSLTLTALGGDDDASVVADTRLTYQHLLRADNGALEVTLPGSRLATVGGFPSKNVRAIDVTDPANATELQTSVEADPAGGFRASFTPAGRNNSVVLVFDDSRVLAPTEMVANRPSSWLDGKSGADLLIVTNSAFAQAAATLVPVRQRDGISAAVVDVEDVYDEANFGIRSPQAIRDFLAASQQWRTKPRWVLLVGDASVDPRNYLDLGVYDFVPTKLVGTAYIKTASDDWFTDFNGDGIADVPIGRIPVRTADDATVVFNKLAARGTPSGAWSKSVVAIADRPDGYDFATAASQALSTLPAGYTKQTIAIANSASPSSDVTAALNAGALLVDYVGHGAVEIWSDDVFSSEAAASLANGSRLPFVVTMTCLNGYFHDVYTTSMAEALMVAPNGGAVAVWGSSTLTEPDQQDVMNRELFRQLFGVKGMTIGEAARRAKQVVTDPDVKKSWVLFGDPSMKLLP